MKKISILFLTVLTSCNTLVKHKEDFKPIAHDIIDEEIEDLTESKKYHEK